MDLSAHFTLAELTRTDTGLANVPNAAEVDALRATAAYMETVRVLLGNHPIVVHSAFRSDAVNAAVGGVPTSAHRLCYAVDFECPGFGDPYAVARALAAHPTLAFDQLIYEGTWVHVSRDPRRRRQLLTHHSDNSYTEGVTL